MTASHTDKASDAVPAVGVAVIAAVDAATLPGTSDNISPSATSDATPRDHPPSAPLSVKILATLAILAAAVVAQQVFAPILVALMLGLTLRPIVRRSRKYGLPEYVSATGLLFALILLALLGISRVIEPARHWIETAPEQLQQIERKMKALRAPLAALNDTSAIVQQMTEGPGKSPALPVEMHENPFVHHLTLATNTGTILGHILVVFVLCFFLLTSGDQLLNHVLSCFPRMSEKKLTVELVREIERGIATYLVTVSSINLGLGIVTGVMLWLLGLPNPALWGFLAFLLNYIPFLGPVLCTLVVLAVSLLTFDSIAYASVPPLAFTLVSAIEGNVLTPLILGRSMALNPIVVFVALIAGGWAWGLIGIVLAVPLLGIIKIALDKFEGTQQCARILAS